MKEIQTKVNLHENYILLSFLKFLQISPERVTKRYSLHLTLLIDNVYILPLICMKLTFYRKSGTEKYDGKSR